LSFLSIIGILSVGLNSVKAREKFGKILHRNKITDCGIKEILGGEAGVAEKLSVESENAGADLVIVADKGRNVFLFTAVRKYY